MYRQQKLKGCHKVGSLDKSGSYSKNTAPSYFTQSPGFNSPQSNNVSADRSWDWGDPPQSQQTWPSHHQNPPPRVAHNASNQPSHEAKHNFQQTVSQDQVSSLQQGQTQTEIVNGTDSQGQVLDDWNWGNEGNWDDWGTNEMATDIANNNNNKQRQQQQQQQQQQIHQPKLLSSEHQQYTYQQQQQHHEPPQQYQFQPQQHGNVQHHHQPPQAYQQQEEQIYSQKQNYQLEDQNFQQQNYMPQNQNYHPEVENSEPENSSYQSEVHNYQPEQQCYPPKQQDYQLKQDHQSKSNHLQEHLSYEQDQKTCHQEQQNYEQEQKNHLHEQQNSEQEQINYQQQQQRSNDQQQETYHQEQGSSEREMINLQEQHTPEQEQTNYQQQQSYDQEQKIYLYEQYSFEQGQKNYHQEHHEELAQQYESHQLPDQEQNLSNHKQLSSLSQSNSISIDNLQNSSLSFNESNNNHDVQNPYINNLQSTSDSYSQSDSAHSHAENISSTSEVPSGYHSNFGSKYAVELSRKSSSDRQMDLQYEQHTQFQPHMTFPGSDNQSRLSFSDGMQSSPSGNESTTQTSDAQNHCEKNDLHQSQMKDSLDQSVNLLQQSRLAQHFEGNASSNENSFIKAESVELQNLPSSSSNISDDLSACKVLSSENVESELNRTQKTSDDYVHVEENWNSDWNWEKEGETLCQKFEEEAENENTFNKVSGETVHASQPPQSSYEIDFQHVHNLGEAATSYQNEATETSSFKVPIESSNLPVGSWDDEWGDGWEIKHQDESSKLDQLSSTSNEQQIPGTSISPIVNPFQDQLTTETTSCDHTERVEKYEEKREEYQRERGASCSDSVPEVPNIEVLNQELQGIFSVPSESSLVLSLDPQESQQEAPLINAQSLEENFDLDDIALKTSISDLCSNFIDGPSAKNEVSTSKQAVIQEQAIIQENKPPSSLSTAVTSNSATYELPQSPARIPLNRSSELFGSRPSPQPSPHSQGTPLSTHSSVTLSRPSSNQSAHMTPVASSEAEKLSNETMVKIVDSSFGGVTETVADISNKENPVQPPTSVPVWPGPTGNIPSLQARKGSPFQPPTIRRSSAGTIPTNSLVSVQKSLADMSVSQNPLLSSEPQNHGVKLCIASPPHSVAGDNNLDSVLKGLPLNNVPLVITDFNKSESVNENNGPFLAQIPPAHLSNTTTQVRTPKVRTLNSMDNTPSSPAVLDLTNLNIKQEPNPDPPNFSRMIPGESTKGESSTAAAFQNPPTIPPAMPSGRVVTGNANPQPIPSARVKQEDVRSPPDGPDTGTMVDKGSNVVPPVRSETIGSEDHAARPLPPNRRDEKEGRRDRETWDRERDYYPERFRDRKRDGRDYYRSESPPGRRPSDREYEDRRRLRRDTDEDEDDDEDDVDDRRKYAEGKRDRRRRAYEDELDRYRDRPDRDGGYRKDRRRGDYRYPHEDDDPYFEGRLDRSRPTSRSSSFGNLDTESGQEHSSHHDDYYDRGLRGREREYLKYRKRDTKERDSYARGYPPYPDQYASRDMYDPQSYYYYYQNYQKYLEQHPYYREYYRHYYGRYGYPTGESLIDDKASTRSGRSSVNDDMKKSSLSSGDISGVPSMPGEGVNDVHQRKSPHLFTGPHLSASFTPGGKLLLVLPNDPKDGEKATVQVRNVQKMLAIDPDFALRIQKMKAYPGPLTVNETHKDIVLRFCEEKAREASTNECLADKDSVVLIWDYLSLLVKQNGNVCGADLANLLVKGRNSATSALPDERMMEISKSETNSMENGAMDDQLATKVAGTNQADLIRKFKEYLCLGMKKEAVDFAIREGLWGYAMTLAAKMDSVTHARVMASFIHSIPSTDVLQTLIQHLSGKKPEVTKSYSLEKWGDWRQHLAMLVSNSTGNVQKDKASIVALGDALAARQLIHAAHLCYLAAEVEWGTFSEKASKLVLIGSSTHQPFQLFASEDAIQRTEIYEFAKSLDSSNPLLYTFQSYKLIYALRLTECGFPNEALRYCEVISQAVMKQPSLFQVEFVSQVWELASQLKFHDVHYQMGEGEISDMPDPEWLRNLQSVLHTMQYQAAEAQRCAEANSMQTAVKEDAPSRLSVRDSYSLNNSAGVSPEYMHYQPSREEHGSRPESSIPPDTVPERKFSGVNGIVPQVDERVMNEAPPPYESLPANLNNEPATNFNTSAPPSMSMYGDTSPQPQPPSAYQPWQQPQQSWEADQSNQPPQWQPEPQAQEEHYPSDLPSQPQPAPQWQNKPLNNQPNQFQPNQHYSQPWHQPNEEVKRQYPLDQNAEPPLEGMNPGENNQDPIPVTTPPGSVERTAEEEEYWALMSGKDKGPTPRDSVDSSVKKEAPKAKVDDESSDLKQDDKKSQGFLGSLFGWRKNSNQAKLPDDKDPSIVWDDNKKKWVNKDASDSEDAPPPPPPLDAVGAPPASLTTLRGGNRKSRYVDPVGEKNRTKAAVSPMIPPMASTPLPAKPTGIPEQQQPMEGSQAPPHHFMQPEGLHTGSRPQPQQSVPPPPQETPDIDPDSSGSIPMMTPGATQSQPMFFNPSQFQGGFNAAPNPPKRVGPVRRSFNPQR